MGGNAEFKLTEAGVMLLMLIIYTVVAAWQRH